MVKKGGDNFVTIETDDECCSAEGSQYCHCDLCGRNYATMSDLTAHIKHHVGINFLCEVNKYEGSTHNTHPTNNESQDSSNKCDINALRYNQCHICSRNFSTSAEFQLHSIKHLPGKTLKCRFCDLPQTIQTHVTQHERICNKNKFKNGSSHICPLCDESFTQEEFLDEHMCIDHKCEKYWLMYKASINKQLLGNSASDSSGKRNKRTMDKTSTEKKNPNNICSLCGNSFRRRGYLHKHIRQIHNCIKYKQLLDSTSASVAFDRKKVTKPAFMKHKVCNKTEITNEAQNCPLCNKSLSRRSSLIRHIITIHNYEKYWELLHKSSSDSANDQTEILKCPDCGFESASHESVIRHFYSNHNSKQDNPSKRLVPQISSSNMTNDQRLRVQDAISFHCDLCGKKFRQLSDVSAHIQNHVKIPLHCGKCDKVYSTLDHYKRHNNVHHRTNFSCRRCGDVFETVDGLESHRLTVHCKGSQIPCKYKLMPCKICGKYFRKDGLKQHMLIVHTKDRMREPYICDVCGQKYLTRPNYFNHVREHKGLKRLTCSICNSCFMSEEGLESHKQTHPKVSRPYKCRYCDATYTKHNHRKKHENTRHIRNYSKKCPDCGKLFLDRQRLKLHSVVHTKQKRHECAACGMKFTQHSSLNRHKKIHGEDKIHACTECGLKFVQKYSLTRHMLVHSGEKPHQCLQCPQAFRQVFMLTQHVRKQHSGAE